MDNNSALSPASNLSFPQILHFLHNEWRQFEMERSQWEIEKQELKAKVAQLEGEKRGFEVLKTDLLKRVKMLEYALKQERAKYLKSAGQNVSASALSAVGESGQAQSGSAPADALSQAQQQAPHSLKDKYSTLNLSTTKRNTSSKTRELLKQYLQEVGYSDSLSSVPGGEWRFNSLRFNSSNSKGSGAASSGKYNTINFNEGQAPMLMLSAKQQQQQQANEEKNALKNMFVPALKSTDDNDLSSDFTSSSVSSDSTPAAPSVNVKKEAPSEGTKSAWENMFSSGNGMEGSETVILPPKMMKQMEASSKKNNRRTVIGPGASMNGGSFGSNSAVLSGELADLSVESNTTAASADLVSKSDSAASTADLAPRSWKPKLTLKSHLDSVTNVAFHPNDLSLITCGEDSMIKYWSLESYGAMKKPPMDIEPIYTYRGHSGPVYSCLISETVPENFSTESCQNGLLYSAGADGLVRLWSLPEKNTQAYSKYDYKRYSLCKFMASDDCIWEIKMHPLKPLLATLSSDGFVKLWNINDFSGDSFNNPPKAVVSIKTSAIPTSMDFLHTDLSKMVISYSDSSLVLFDVNTGAETGRFQKADSTYDGTTATQINKVICHQTLPMVITGHEDKHIRFFDPRNEDTVTSMVAHLDAVSCMDISPNGLVLVSGGHDSSTRAWDISTRTCLQEFTSHRKKFDEAIHSVKFHPRLIAPSQNQGSSVSGGSSWLATCGADSVAKVYHCA